MTQDNMDRFAGEVGPGRCESPGLRADPEGAEARNLAVLQEVYQALGRGDFEAALAPFHDDVTLEIGGTAAMPFFGRWKGLAQVAEAIRRNFGMLLDQAPEIHSIEASGDRVKVIFHERGRLRETGVPYAVLCSQDFSLADGKIRRVDQYVEDLVPTADA